MAQTHKFTAGNGTVTSLFDGHLEIGAEAFSGMSDEQIASCHEDAGIPAGPLKGTLSAYVYQDGAKNVLIDSGGREAFPDTGELLTSLTSIGLEPDDIDEVLCTHLHPDHIGGLIKDSKPVFRNAELKLAEADRVFWLDETNKNAAPEMFQVFFDLAAGVLSVYGDRVSTFSGETEVSSGINALPLPGHTPGHTGFQIGDGESGLLIWGDIVHVELFQLRYHQAAIVFDVDKEQAVSTRLAMFERAASERLRIAGMHLAHPGVGHITRMTDGHWFEAASPDG